MQLPHLNKLPRIPGFLNIVEAVNLAAPIIIGERWTKNSRVKELPFILSGKELRVGTDSLTYYQDRYKVIIEKNTIKGFERLTPKESKKRSSEKLYKQRCRAQSYLKQVLNQIGIWASDETVTAKLSTYEGKLINPPQMALITQWMYISRTGFCKTTEHKKRGLRYLIEEKLLIRALHNMSTPENKRSQTALTASNRQKIVKQLCFLMDESKHSNLGKKKPRLMEDLNAFIQNEGILGCNKERLKEIWSDTAYTDFRKAGAPTKKPSKTNYSN